MSVRDDAQKDYEAGLKYKKIAEKYNVSESTVKSWASRYWKKDKVATKNRKRSQPKSKKDATHKRGGQFNNLNAAGSTTNGAPKGNKNALKHGGYSAVYWDTLDDEEKSLIMDIPKSEEELLLDQIKLYSVRERRLMSSIRKVKVSMMITDNEENIKKTDQIFNTMILTETEKKSRVVQREKTINFEHTDNRLLRLEAELTKVQRAKNKCLDSLFRIHNENEKLDLIRENNDIEIEDTSEIDGVIYGG